MKLDVLNTNGKSTGRSIDLPDNLFGAEPNEHAVYLAVKQYLANQRQGTHKAKERGEIKGSMRKIKKQKGTGTARAGSLKNPLYRSGGRIFGPRPRNYSLKLNKKVKRIARISALSDKATNGNLIIMEDFTFDKPKTKEFVNVLNNLELNQTKSIMVTGDKDDILYRSSRNVPNHRVKQLSELSTYDILYAAKLVLSESCVEKLSKQLG